MASGKFKPEKADYSHYLDGGNFVRNLQKLGKIDFDDSRRLIVLAGVLDVEVAVDPEMLGRIFEELVTGRHESGSYYTPKPVVAFMCREALKGYLGTAMPKESAEALALFVDKNDASALRNPELALNALRIVKVCDPACGSGAYLLGMLHELLEQRECLFVASKLDARNTYDRKLEIIQNNLYGVDKDDFAVNIARLRLWLSLVVDDTRNPLEDPTVDVALPNLDFKIESGDSLTAPDPSGGLQPDMFRQQQVHEFLTLKNEFMGSHAGSDEKKKLGKQIDELKKKIEEWAHPKGFAKSADSFDWQVDFAEVFAPELAQSTLGGKMAGIVNSAGGQMEMTEAPKEGGFDIVLANPPYVRQELLGDFKNLLKPIYPEVYNGTADLFVYFYARAHQLLRNGGVSCFISSNKWLRSAYGEKLRQHLLDSQTFQIVIDFGDAPIFQAVAYPSIFLWKKQPRNSTYTLWATVNDLQVCYDEGILEHITRIGLRIPANQFGKDKPRLAQPHDAEKQIAMESSGPRLLEYVKGQIYSGIKTGLNDAFVVDDGTYKKIISKSAKSKDILMPLLRGEDIRRYETQFHNSYLILTKIGVDIEKYPAVFNHLKEYEKAAKQRYDQGNHWWELRACAYYDDFNSPKIVYGEIAPDARFVIDYDQYYLLNTSYFIPVDDWFLLGVLNSQPIDWYFRKIGATIQSGYLRFIRQYVETLPVPDAPQKERDAVAKLAKQAQDLHMMRRRRVENFLREIGVEPAQSTSRNPLESPWVLTEEQFLRRVGQDHLKAYTSAREETMSLTEEAVRVEKEIDERVKSLYGV